MTRTTRKTRDERREDALVAAREEFARAGLHGSVDVIAEQAGITASYLLRLFGTKTALFLATVERAFAQMLDGYEHATEDKNGTEALEAIASAGRLIASDDRVMLMIQLQAFAACDDDEIRIVVSVGYGRIVELAQRVSGATPVELAVFTAYGMQLRALAAMRLLSAVDCRTAQVINQGSRGGLGLVENKR